MFLSHSWEELGFSLNEVNYDLHNTDLTKTNVATVQHSNIIPDQPVEYLAPTFWTRVTPLLMYRPVCHIHLLYSVNDCVFRVVFDNSSRRNHCFNTIFWLRANGNVKVRVHCVVKRHCHRSLHRYVVTSIGDNAGALLPVYVMSYLWPCLKLHVLCIKPQVCVQMWSDIQMPLKSSFTAGRASGL